MENKLLIIIVIILLIIFLQPKKEFKKMATTIEQDAEDSFFCSGDIAFPFDPLYPCANAVDENWESESKCYSYGSKICWVYENFTIPTATESSIWTFKYKLWTDGTHDPTSSVKADISCYNYAASSWTTFYSETPYDQAVTSIILPDDCISSSPLQVRSRVDYPEFNGQPQLTYIEGKVIWNIEEIGPCICNSLPECQTQCPNMADEYCMKKGEVSGDDCIICGEVCNKWDFLVRVCIPSCFLPPSVPD